MHQFVSVAVVATLGLAVLGCSGDGMVEIYGTVTIDTEPIEDGTIQFLPSDGQGPSAAARLERGQYTLRLMPGKKKVKQGLVRVFDLTGKKLLEGRTNEQGEFVFKPPSLLIDLRIEVEAGMGHKAAFVLKAEESSDHLGPERIQDVTGEEKNVSSGPVSTHEEQIRMIVEQVLDARLKPVMRELVEIRKEKGPGFIEIIGGIGYILGIMGLILYFKTREKGGDR